MGLHFDVLVLQMPSPVASPGQHMRWEVLDLRRMGDSTAQPRCSRSFFSAMLLARCCAMLLARCCDDSRNPTAQQARSGVKRSVG
jgi:hypothetical protein